MDVPRGQRGGRVKGVGAEREERAVGEKQEARNRRRGDIKSIPGAKDTRCDMDQPRIDPCRLRAGTQDTAHRASCVERQRSPSPTALSY